MKRFIYLILIAAALTLSTFAQNSRTNRIYRPCPGTTTPAAVTISVLGAISITPCSGQTVSIATGLTSGSVLFAGTNGLVSQDSSNFIWDDTNNRLVVGSFQTIVAPSTPALVAQFSAESVQGTRFNLVNFSNGTGSGTLRGFKARGTAASPEAVQSGDYLISVAGGGWSPTQPTSTRGTIGIMAAENWTGSAQGTAIAFTATALGSASLGFEQARFYSTGFHFGSAMQLGWSSASTQPATIDTGFARQSAGVIRATNGSTAIRALIGGGAAVASANPLPTPTGRVFHVTGTTGFNAIQSGNFAAGVCITLIFDNALTVTDNAIALDLAGNFVTTANDTLSLCYDGDRWYETGRSVN